MNRILSMFTNPQFFDQCAYQASTRTGQRMLSLLAAPALVTASLAALVQSASAAPLPTETAPARSPVQSPVRSSVRSPWQSLKQSPESQQLLKQSRRRPRPPRRLPPNRVQPGGGLDITVYACQPESRPLTAIVPVENPTFTAIAHPTFLFYFPDDPAAVDYAEFILLSADEKEEIYAVQFTPTESGIISVSIPPDADKALEAGQAYHWYLNLHCNTTTGVPSVNGWVQRRSEQLAGSSERAQNVNPQLPQLWYDAIAQTAAALTNASSNPPSVIAATTGTSDPQARWNTLLSAAGLSELINTPIVGDVVIEPSVGETEQMSVTEGI